MRNKLTSLLVSAMMLSSLILSINHSISMEDKAEKENKESQEIDFASCLSDPNSPAFTQSIDKVIGSVDTHGHFLEHIKSIPEALPYKKTLLALHKLFKLQGHMTIDLDNNSLFKIFSDSCELYPESSVWNHCLAFCFFNEIGTKRDLDKARQLYEIASQGDFSCSFYNLACMYENGSGVEKNLVKALKLYQKATELGNTDAMNRLATMYKTGDGVKQDLKKAIELYQKMSEMGNAEAMNNIAFMYYKGYGVQKNLVKARGLFEDALTLGNTNAMVNLACMYRDGNGVDKDIDKAIGLYEKAIKLDNTGAMVNLAFMYQNGEGVEQNLEKALKLYEQAVKLDCAHAMNFLAVMYKSGQGVEQNLEKALKLYEKAVELGNVTAMNNLAAIYRNGNGVEKNIEKALKLYEQAVNLGNAEAMNSLGIMYYKGNGVQKDMEKALDLWERAGNLGNTEAMSNLAFIYDTAEKQDIEKAQYFYEKSFFLGGSIARENLPFFLFKHHKITRLIELEFERTDLLPQCSTQFWRIVRNEGGVNIIKTTIESLIQKKYKEYLYASLKGKQSQPLTFGKDTFSFGENDFFCGTPKPVVLYKIALDLDPKSVFALASTSKHFYNILRDRVIVLKRILGTLSGLKKAFMKKLKNDPFNGEINVEFLEELMNIKNIVDMLCPKVEKEEQNDILLGENNAK